MKRLMVLATVIAVFAVLVGATTAFAQQERDEVMLIIPMKYMSAATAAQLFGGQIVTPSPLYGQSNFGNRGSIGNRGSYGNRGTIGGGYGRGSYQSGRSIGGGYDDYNSYNRGQSRYDRNDSYLR